MWVKLLHNNEYGLTETKKKPNNCFQFNGNSLTPGVKMLIQPQNGFRIPTENKNRTRNNTNKSIFFCSKSNYNRLSSSSPQYLFQSESKCKIFVLVISSNFNMEEMLYAVRCLKSSEDMILALAGQFKQLSHEPEKFR